MAQLELELIERLLRPAQLIRRQLVRRHAAPVRLADLTRRQQSAEVAARADDRPPRLLAQDGGGQERRVDRRLRRGRSGRPAQRRRARRRVDVRKEVREVSGLAVGGRRGRLDQRAPAERVVQVRGRGSDRLKAGRFEAELRRAEQAVKPRVVAARATGRGVRIAPRRRVERERQRGLDVAGREVATRACPRSPSPPATARSPRRPSARRAGLQPTPAAERPGLTTTPTTTSAQAARSGPWSRAPRTASIPR